MDGSSSSTASRPLAEGAQLNAYVEFWNQMLPDKTVVLSEDLFRTIPEEELQRELFRRNVTHVWIEPFSYCNRRCYFCPNADEKRLAPNVLLSEPVLDRVLSDLSSINYSGRLFFHEYNEPLAHPRIYDVLNAAHDLVPLAEKRITTNGDYLNREAVRRLAAAGVAAIKVSLYGPDHGHFERGYMDDALAKLAQRTGLGIGAYHYDETNKAVAAVLDHPTIAINVQGRDYGETGFDRGQLVPFRTNDDSERVHPCFAPIFEFHVDFEGSVKPCCNLLPDREHHRDFTLGNLNDGRSIFAHYAGEQAAAWRRRTSRVSPDIDVCRTCSWPWT